MTGRYVYKVRSRLSVLSSVTGLKGFSERGSLKTLPPAHGCMLYRGVFVRRWLQKRSGGYVKFSRRTAARVVSRKKQVAEMRWWIVAGGAEFWGSCPGAEFDGSCLCGPVRMYLVGTCVVTQTQVSLICWSAQGAREARVASQTRAPVCVVIETHESLIRCMGILYMAHASSSRRMHH